MELPILHETMFQLSALPIARWYHDVPVLNYAIDDTVIIIGVDNDPCCIIPPTGRVTSVPSVERQWIKRPEGIVCRHRDFDYPIDLPEEYEAVSVITPEAYHDLLQWNNFCEPEERFDLSWTIVLGHQLAPERSPYPRCYDGLFLTHEVAMNRELISEEDYQALMSDGIMPNQVLCGVLEA